MTDIQNILDKTQWMLWSAQSRTQDEGLREFLDNAIADLRNADVLLKTQGNSVVAFLGKTNVGKSTLMNALLGEKVAPVYNGDWTARPVEYYYAKNQSILLAEVYPPKEIPFQSQNDLLAALKQLSTMEAPGAAIGHDHVVVNLDLPLLQNGLILCDMPGFLACTGEKEDDAQGSHHEDIKKYLQKQSGVVTAFLVTDADLPSESVIRYVREILSGYELHIVVNYRHALGKISERKEKLEESWRYVLNRVLFFHYIDAKQAQKEHTDELDDLITCLKSYATQDGKICMVRGKLIRVLKYVGLYLHDFKKCQDPAALFETTRIKVVHRLLREFGDTQALETFENLWRTSK